MPVNVNGRSRKASPGYDECCPWLEKRIGVRHTQRCIHRKDGVGAQAVARHGYDCRTRCERGDDRRDTSNDNNGRHRRRR